jgi:hypothetical protein
MTHLAISGNIIRRDTEGRYSLNDLHRAAGGEDRHRPGQFTRTDAFRALVDELETAQISAVSIEEGRGGGTYVVEPLVVAYASWISARFHLEVINTFLAVKKSNVRALPSFVEDGCTLIESATRTLRLAASASLGMYQRLGSKVGHADLLPAYAADAPDGQASSEATKALSSLLVQHGVTYSARQAYVLLAQAGIVERKSRKATRGEKQFWCITEAGLKYGKNVSHPENPRQTQPHFYESRFADLVQVAGLAHAAA